MWTFIVVFILLTAGLRAQNYGKSLRGVVHHVCPDEHVVSQINSSYNSTEEDRHWTIECKASPGISNCSWSGFHNLYDKELVYNCPTNHVVAGIYSVYNRAHKDRSWNFRCCSASNLTTIERRETPKFNYMKEDFGWELPEDHYLTGFQTHQKDDNGDHRWSFKYCRGTTPGTKPVTSKIVTLNEHMRDLFTEGDVPATNARNARICTNCKWPKSGQEVLVPYTVSDRYNTYQKNIINDAISEFHARTCVRFVPRTSQRDYLDIDKRGGCWSWVGRIRGTQQISLNDGCIYKGIIQHELIHALGFWHEQSRSDRDLYVRIHTENMWPGTERNFAKLETNNLNVPYDFNSVMHYGETDFSRNGEPTISPLIDEPIGMRNEMSDNDVLKINLLYGCTNSLQNENDWDNELTSTLSRSCLSGQAVSGITSLYSSDHKDRRWRISCKNFQASRSCYWTRFVNGNFDNFNFNCGDDKVIAGAESVYSSIFRDRKWKFYCCSAPGFTTSSCRTTPQVNYYQEYFSWTVASNNFLTGVSSTFDQTTRDRRWSFTSCQGNSQ